MDTAAPTPATPRDAEARAHLLVGALQALLAGALYASATAPTPVWPATQPAVFVPLLLFMALAPLAFYLSSAAPLRRRAGIALGAGALALAVGLYHGLTVSGLGLLDGERLPFTPDDTLPPLLLLALALLVAVPALAVAQGARVRYEAWFDGLLHNTLLLLQGGLVTGLFWLVLFSAASLFRLVKLPFLHQLIEHAAFWIPATALVFGYGVSLAVKHRGVARFLFERLTQLCGWIYPLAGALGLAFVASWLVQGIGPLLQTRRAAFLLLWFAVLCVLLVNAASRGGLDAPRYPRWLRRALSTGLLVLLPMVAVAVYALGLRIAQHGWTVDRVWGVFVAGVVAVFALGYALNALAEWAGRRERCLVPAANAAAAVFVVAGLLLLVGGALDPRRLSVSDQLQRLARGAPDEEGLVRYLAREGGVFGRRALEALAANDPALGGVPVARQRLAHHALLSARERKALEAELVKTLPVLPAGTAVPAALYGALVRGEYLGHCTPETCLVWRLPAEVAGEGVFTLLSREPGVGGSLWAANPQGEWFSRGQLPALGVDERCQRREAGERLFDAVRAGQVGLRVRPGRDIEAGGLRFPIERWDGSAGC
ncbi:hypothetical protein [Hydrogenophaga sp. T2]|uniref:hypothetical protein n=1 Tax=Hydrogenophaga sp. T2 TaxID=3132823 RepID=UPI003CEFCD9A